MAAHAASYPFQTTFRTWCVNLPHNRAQQVTSVAAPEHANVSGKHVLLGGVWPANGEGHRCSLEGFR